MSAALEIKGTLTVGEASAVLADLKSRTGGATWVHQLALTAMVAIAAVLGWEIARLFGAVIGVALADFTYNFLGARLLRADYRRRWKLAGQPLDLPMSLAIEDVALVSQVAGVKRTIAWHAISELFRSHGYWVFIVQGEGIFAPQRLFDSADAQKSFVAAALSRMSAEARARSLSAVEFATVAR